MRVTTLSTVGLVALYLALVGGFALWQHRAMADAEQAAMGEAAKLIGHEIALAVSEASLGQLLSPDPEARMRLLRVLHGVTRSSEVVTSIAVVGPDGTVLASDNFVEVGQQFESPPDVFHGSVEPKLVRSDRRSGGSPWQLVVPLGRDGGARGYVRLALASQQLADLYTRSMQRLWVAALAGLAAVAGLGVGLHLLLVRRSAGVVTLLEGALAGRDLAVPRVDDEFALAYETAGRVGRELQAARERSVQARQRLSALSLVMDVGVLLIGSGRELEFANRHACRLLGRQDAEDLARAWPAIRPLLDGALDRAAASDASVRADLEVPTAEAVRRLRCQTYRFPEEERDAFLVLLRDRAMLDALETDLMLASQLRVLTRVYRAITHDIRAPLNSMVMNLALLESTLDLESGADEGERTRRGEYLGVLRDELARLDRSLQALLAETAPSGPERSALDARDLVRDLERLLTAQAHLQRVRLVAELPGSPVPVLGQHDRLKQALLNVAINGLEAMPDGGVLGLRLAARDGCAEVAISDCGPGIPEEVRQRIFDLHFTTKAGGTGIGLYVARSIVEAHGGEMAVDSTPGQGSEFRIRLPLAAVEG